jgi:cell division protein FtsQ
MKISRARLRKQLRALLVLLVIAGAAYGLGWSNFFQVSSISVRGTNQSALLLQDVRQARVILHTSMPMARVDVKALQGSIAKETWLKSIHISRNWLSGKVSVSVAERTPIAEFVDSDGTTKYFDAAGFAFASPQGYGQLPTVTLASNASSANSAEAANIRGAAATFISQMPPDVISAMQSLTISGVDHIFMVSTIAGPSITIAWGSASELPLKIKVLRALLVRPESAKAHSFDLSQPSAPVTK